MPSSFECIIIIDPWTCVCSDGTVDYQARQQRIDFVMSPYYDADNLSFDDAQDTLQLTYRSTLLYTERDDQKTTGLDALAVRPAQQSGAVEDPPFPIAPSNGHLSIDAEGLALNADGTYVQTCFRLHQFLIHCSTGSG